MTQNTRDWVRWIRIMDDPYASVRGFSLANLEFISKTPEAVQDVMYGTLPGDSGKQQPGKFWVVAEQELMKRCPQMQAFAQGRDWFFPAEFCDPFFRPNGIEPVYTREASDAERSDALNTFKRSLDKIAK